MAPLSLPPHVLERLKQANIKRLSGAGASDYVLDSGVERVDKDEDPGLMSQMQDNGFPKAFCEFTLDFLGRLREAIPGEKCSFFEHFSNGGGGQPMFKNYVGNCRVFWRSFNNMKFA